ncbi:hypothetical protein D3C84_1247340 [compost metagenome]
MEKFPRSQNGSLFDSCCATFGRKIADSIRRSSLYYKKNCCLQGKNVSLQASRKIRSLRAVEEESEGRQNERAG